MVKAMAALVVLATAMGMNLATVVPPLFAVALNGPRLASVSLPGRDNRHRSRGSRRFLASRQRRVLTIRRWGLCSVLQVIDAPITGARVALFGGGVQDDQPPFSVAADDGDASEFERIRAGDYQQATAAKPLYPRGWQLIDEMNRARAGQPPSGYIAPPTSSRKPRVQRGGIRSAQRWIQAKAGLCIWEIRSPCLPRHHGGKGIRSPHREGVPKCRTASLA
jgi:hypothetical protein